MTKPDMTPSVRRILRKEFYAFFRVMTTEHPEKRWPAIPPDEFVDALADALLRMGDDRVSGLAMLQTLVFELQDKINSRTKD